MRWPNEWHEEWVRKFAWFPVRVDGGVTVWLEHFEQRYAVIPWKPMPHYSCGRIERRACLPEVK